jgi:hypothetical protein
MVSDESVIGDVRTVRNLHGTMPVDCMISGNLPWNT